MKIKYFICVFLGLLEITAYAQNVDSLYYRFLEIKTGQKYLPEGNNTGNEYIEKSGTSLINKVKLNLNLFTKEQQTVIKPLLARPVSETSIVSQSGKFRIHYDTQGENKPAFDVNVIAAIFDSVYQFEVETLGYLAPPSDFGSGGDDLYDIYVINLPTGIYGYTETEQYLSGDTYTTFMVVDNDYVGYYSKGLNGLRVTAAHEFHHAIQMGRYILREEDTFYYEITSTAMEEFTFSYVNDYFYYVKSFMNTPSRSLKEYSYNLAIWNIYLKEKYGYDIIKRTWELMRTKTAMNAIAAAIEEYGSTFKAELSNFGTWVYFSGYRHKTDKYFPDAKYFPALKISMSYSFVPPLQIIGVNSSSASNNFIRFGYGADTVVTIITNGDYLSSGNMTWVDYSLRNTEQEDFIKINEGYYYKYQVPEVNKKYFCSSAIFNDSSSYNNGTGNISYVYPQPFTYLTDSEYGLNLPVKIKTDVGVNLYIYDINMNLLYAGVHNFISGPNPYINFNGITDKGRLSSGVYIFVTESEGNILKGKFAVLND